MSDIIYISRRCKYCQELLVFLHKYKQYFNYPIVDIDTNKYPSIIKSVPCMLINNKILPGDELFKFLEYILEEKNVQTEKREPNKPIPKEKPPDKPPDSDINGFCFGGSCLQYSALEGELYDDQLNYEKLDNISAQSSIAEKNITNTNNSHKEDKIKRFDEDLQRLNNDRII